jgi:hypothetical protein
MPRANTVQTNFTSGEISPLMYGRVDVTKYFNGARKLQNMVVLPQGGSFRRPGTYYMGGVKNDNYAILRKFVFSATQAYVLEFGNLYVRFWNRDGQILNTGTPVEVVTPYASADLPYLVFSQSADVLYITHPSYAPQKLSRLSDISWTLTPVSFTDGPYLDVDSSNNRIQIALVSDVATMQSNAAPDAASVTMIASSAIFAAGNVGKYLEYYRFFAVNGVKVFGLSLVTAFTDTTHDIATLQSSSVIDPPTTGTPAVITFGGGAVSSTISMFSTGSVGKFVRLSGSQAWYQVTAYVNSKVVAATALTIVTYNTSAVTVTPQAGFAVGDVSKFVEYQRNGNWYLAKITTFTSPTEVKVQVLDNIVVPDDSVSINVNTGSNGTVANKTGVFNPSDVGKHVRDTNSQKWGLITAYGDSTKVTTTLDTMYAYVYPGLTMTLLDDRVITVNVFGRNNTFDPVNDIGTSIRLQFNGQWRYLTLTSITSALAGQGTLSDFIPFDPLNASNPYNNGFCDQFRLPAWTVANGFPAICTFHTGRLWFANSALQPTTLWSSEIDDYESMSPTDPSGAVLDTNAITFTIASSEVNPIVWMKSGPVMLIGTQGAEFQLKASNLNLAISPTNSVIVPQTQYGSINTHENAIRSGSQTLFIQRGGSKIREMVYDFSIDAFTSKDISIISEHLFRSAASAATNGNPLTAAKGIVSLDLSNSPLTIVWFVISDGTVVGMTYDHDQDVVAFHNHVFGGGGVAEAVCVTPDTTTLDTDIVWFIVKRTINGSVKRYVEQFSVNQIFSKINVPQYMDCHIKKTSQTGDVNDFNGMDHLNAATVQVVIDGIYIGTKTVGAVTTPAGTGFNLKYHVNTYVASGFQCPGIVGLLDPEGGSASGSSQGKKKRVPQTAIRVENSPHPKLASAPGGLMDARETVSGADDPTSTDYTRIIPDVTITAAGTIAPYPVPAAAGPVYYTADIKATTDDSFDNGGRISIVQDDPYPLKVVAVLHKLDTNE